jgi:hypothetical protein
MNHLKVVAKAAFGNSRPPEYPYGGGLEYFYRSPVSRKRRREGNPMSGGITGAPCSWRYKYGDLALQVGGVSDETVKYGLEFRGTWARE